MQIVDIQKPYDYTRTIRDIQTLLTYYPYGSLEWIGCSVLGKPIPHILIGNGERKVHINASFHANEWITTNVLLQFVEDYLAALHYDQALNGQEARALFNQVTLSTVPIVNPDGVDLVLKRSSCK
ncbi:Gamma-D-glutamyl-L-diamino acid endopeptidase 1 [Priestia megaterium WSH-002]|uniref:Gamma-D-glutamyl-L-diamino acid endopeptidase 1 n=1 Tax=Priestia megaterium (strain WSH-002) TaxID=1006007 RepID=A0A8D3WV90_PRIMW|nr:M14 family zinc carboxypeptidase [Priestia megaterium]AEN87619.1 Gamma-D-glutamyl-L-diamino acid endopeptidase 1 [Priestia megaterium WSH-002]